MSDPIRFERREHIAVLTVDNPPVNALSRGIPEAIAAAIQRANQDDEVQAIALIGAGKTFMAGADIREFTGGDPTEYLMTLATCNKTVEDSAKPVVAAIHGTALGAGLELALAAHYRIISETAQVGQPEVKLGLIPGAGATQRLPRIAGAAKALEMCVYGESLRAPQAFAQHIVDQVIPADRDFLNAALQFARGVVGLPFERTCNKTVQADSTLFANARKRATEKLVGQTAPLHVIEAIEASLRLPFDEGLVRERELFAACLKEQAPALIYLFFAERAAAKLTASPQTVSDSHAGIIFASHPDPELRKLNALIYLDHPGTRLVEIVRGSDTPDTVVASAIATARQRGKTPVVTRDFVGDRLVRRYNFENDVLVREGMPRKAVLHALQAFGMPSIRPLNGDGSPDGSREMAQKTILSVANEGEKIVKENLVERASDIDVLFVLGYGFPAWRGGPMYFASMHEQKETQKE